MTWIIAIWESGDPLTKLVILMGTIIGMATGIIKVPKFINWTKNKKSKSNDVFKTHIKCEYWPNLKNLIVKAIDKGMMIQRIKINEAIAEQMAEADELFVDIKDIIRDNYFKLYKEFRGGEVSGLLDEPDVNKYDVLLDSSESMFKGMTRRYMRKNHFIDKSDEEFRIYIDRRTEDYQKALSKYLNERYLTAHYHIAREVVFESNIRNCMPEVKQKVSIFFYRVREIARAKQLLIDELEEHLEAFYAEDIG